MDPAAATSMSVRVERGTLSVGVCVCMGVCVMSSHYCFCRLSHWPTFPTTTTYLDHFSTGVMRRGSRTPLLRYVPVVFFYRE